MGAEPFVSHLQQWLSIGRRPPVASEALAVDMTRPSSENKKVGL